MESSRVYSLLLGGKLQVTKGTQLLQELSGLREFYVSTGCHGDAELISEVITYIDSLEDVITQQKNAYAEYTQKLVVANHQINVLKRLVCEYIDLFDVWDEDKDLVETLKMEYWRS